MEHFYRNRRKSLLTCSRKSTKPQRNVIIRFKGFNFENRKTRDNCHYTGLYWEAAHSDFKLKYPIPEFIPFVYQGISKEVYRDDAIVFSENQEKYINFNVKINVKLTGVTNKKSKEGRNNINLRFIDRFRFMTLSFDKLANNLFDTCGDQCDKCKMQKKSWNNLEETKFRPKNILSSNLSVSGISGNNYENA